MADVDVSPLQEETPPVPSADDHERSRPSLALHRSKSVLALVLEVLLIGTGVFLGLAGEQWRDNAQKRELAAGTLRRFRTELQANRRAVADVKDKHVATLATLRAYLAASPEARAQRGVPSTPTDPAFLERTAWDLALATQALAHIDPDLALAISRVYAAQQQLDDLRGAITAAMYARPNLMAFLEGVDTYFDDCTLHEPRLLALYDDILPRLDRALAE